MTIQTPPSEQISAALDRIDWDFADENPSAPNMRQNGVHWYPATFVAPLIGTMLDILAPKQPATVMDPFCGAGTAPLEAWYRGHRALGADSNLFAVGVSKARIKLVRHASVARGKLLAERFDDWARPIRTDDAALKEIVRSAAIPQEAERWFVPEVLVDLAIAKEWIERDAPREWRTVLRVLLSSLLKRCSRVRDYHYTYIVDRSRVKSPALEDPALIQRFKDKLQMSFRGAANLRTALSEQGMVDLSSPPQIRRAVANDLAHIADGEVDVVVTSPPYFGMNDYVRSQYLTSLVYPSRSYERDLLAESGSRRNRTSEPALARYIEDMNASFQECKRTLRSGGMAAVFLGHSQSRLSREGDVVGQLKGALERLEFEPVWRGERRIRFRKITSTPSSSEFVWVFRRS